MSQLADLPVFLVRCPDGPAATAAQDPEAPVRGGRGALDLAKRDYPGYAGIPMCMWQIAATSAVLAVAAPTPQGNAPRDTTWPETLARSRYDARSC